MPKVDLSHYKGREQAYIKHCLLEEYFVQIVSILVDEDKNAFAHLQEFAAKKSLPGFGVHALSGGFVENIPAIKRILGENTRNPFRFVFLDPKGWADIPILQLKPLLQSRSCELLINLMTKHIIRFLDEPDRAASYNNLLN